MFAVGNEMSWLIDLENNTIVEKFDIDGDTPWSDKIAAFVDEDTIIAVDSQRRISPRIVWISISKKKIIREMPIVPFIKSCVSKHHFLIHNGKTYDVRRSTDGELVGDWDISVFSNFYFSGNGKYIARSPSFYSSGPGKLKPVPTMVYDIETQQVIAIQGDSKLFPKVRTYRCVVNEDPLIPVQADLDSCTYLGKEIPAAFRNAKFSLDGKLLDTGQSIVDAATGDVKANYGDIYDQLGVGFGATGFRTALSADNKQLFVSKVQVDKGIGVYDRSTMEHLYDIRISQSRWQKIWLALGMIFGTCLLWVFVLRHERKSQQASVSDSSLDVSKIENPKLSKIVWGIMILGGVFHIVCNIIAMHHIPFSTVWSVDSQFQRNAAWSAVLIVALLLIGLTVAMVVFVKGASGSTHRLKTTAMFQFFIDPINAVLATVSLFFQFRKFEQ